MADLGKGSLYFGYKRKIPSRKKSRLNGFLKRHSNTEVAFDRPSSLAWGLQASFISWSEIGFWRVNPIIDASFNLFANKDHLFKICEINLFKTISMQLSVRLGEG